MTRQQFLRTSAALVATGLVARFDLRANDTTPKTNRFALLSDTHVDGKPIDPYRESADRLSVAVQEVVAWPRDMALINGDAAIRDGQEHDYRLLSNLLEPLQSHCPVAIGLGNHDDREQFRKVFQPAETAAQKECNRHVLVIESEHADWLMLDSLLYVNKAAGFLGKPQRTWLRTYLAQHTAKPVLILVHHTLGDSEGDLLDVRDFLEIARESPQVKAIFYGHSHQYSVKRDGALHLINLPAVGYNFRPADAVGWVAAELRSDGITLTLHAIAGNQERNGEVTQLTWA